MVTPTLSRGALLLYVTEVEVSFQAPAVTCGSQSSEVRKEYAVASLPSLCQLGSGADQHLKFDGISFCF